MCRVTASASHVMLVLCCCKSRVIEWRVDSCVLSFNLETPIGDGTLFFLWVLSVRTPRVAPSLPPQHPFPCLLPAVTQLSRVSGAGCTSVSRPGEAVLGQGCLVLSRLVFLRLRKEKRKELYAVL